MADRRVELVNRRAMVSVTGAALIAPLVQRKVEEVTARDAAAASADRAAVEAALQEKLDLASGAPEAPSIVNKLNLDGSNVGASAAALRAAIGADVADNIKVLAAGIDAKAISLQTLLSDLITVRRFGAIGDGTLHTLQEWVDGGLYANLGAIQVDYPKVTTLTESIDGAAYQKAYDYAISSGRRQVDIGHLRLGLNQTLDLHTRGVATTGFPVTPFESGSTAPGAAMIWFGGALPMMKTNATRHSFRGFLVDQKGSATDWLELNSGAQANIYRDVYFAASVAPFSRSVIQSNGSRLGYSRFSGVQARGVAPAFVNIDGQGTSNSITPFSFDDRCIFGSPGQEMTIVRVKNETLEGLYFDNCTFIRNDEDLVVVDSTDTPAAVAIMTLSVRRCEFDFTSATVPISTGPFFRLQNVANFEMSYNHLYGGGTMEYVADLISSHVASCEGNYFYGLLYLFNPDGTSTVTAGRNIRNTSNTEGVYPKSADSAGIAKPTYGSTVLIDGSRFGGTKHGIYYIDVTNSSSYSIRLGTEKPYYTEPGQIFTVVIRNQFGVISAGAFYAAHFNTAGALVAPAKGMQRSYTFFFDGAKAIEMYRSSGDVSIG